MMFITWMERAVCGVQNFLLSHRKARNPEKSELAVEAGIDFGLRTGSESGGGLLAG